MKVLDEMGTHGFEQLVFCSDPISGLGAIIAIHDTTLGPALGGCRMWPYKSEEAAVMDALRLARGMTYKNAAAGLNFGGGKSVIIGDPRKDKTEELFRAFGRFVETLGGRYITAEDVGTSAEDMSLIALETGYVAGLSGMRGGSGDPSPVTALGVLYGIKACVKTVFGTDSLAGRTVAIQGVGHVGYNLARYLVDEGAEVTVADIYPDKVERAVRDLHVKAVPAEDILGLECDILAPCALGAVIDDESLPGLKCRIVAGAANNQLESDRHGDLLHEKGILYAPDYVINAGGVINVADEFEGGYNRERALKRVSCIYDNVRKVIEISQQEGIPTYKAAHRLAEERIRRIALIRRTYVARGNMLARRAIG